MEYLGTQRNTKIDEPAAKKLSDNLRNDPQLRAWGDPTAHHPIFGTCIEKTRLHEITTMLRWKREQSNHNLPENSLKELKTMKDSLEIVFHRDQRGGTRSSI